MNGNTPESLSTRERAPDFFDLPAKSAGTHHFSNRQVAA